jgi:Flp pilus assembly pilin Flp
MKSKTAVFGSVRQFVRRVSDRLFLYTTPALRQKSGKFLKEEEGQDLIEYTLLIAFICLASAAIFVNVGGSVSGIWTSASSTLSAANTASS